MTHKGTMGIVLLATVLCFVMPGPGRAAQDLDFAVIQPGQPGSPEEAQPVMDAFAAYIRKKTGEAGVKGVYLNKVDSALDFLHHQPPAWGIVRLGFYAQHARAFAMVPIAATRPGGHARDAWRLMVSREGPDDWKAVQGKVLGNMLFEREAAACLLFGVPADRLSFTLAGTFEPLRSVRNVVRGKAAAAVLDQTQYDAIREMPLASEIKIIHVKDGLPTSPVVWFGRPDARTEKLVSALLQMKGDKDAEALRKLLQTDGFAQADPELPEYRLGGKRAICPE